MEPRAEEERPAPSGPEPVDSGVHPLPPTEPEVGRSRWRPSNLTLRLITASVLIPPVLWMLVQGGLWIVGLVLVVNLIAVNEFYNFIEEKGARPNRGIGAIAVAVIPLVVYFGDAFLATSFLTAVLLTTMVLQLAKQQIREAIASISETVFGVFYVGWLLSHAISIRFIDNDLVNRYGEPAASAIPPEMGLFFIVLCLASALGCDSGAYFVGRRYGRRKLAPGISPNKTVEGALGGMAVGALVGAGTKLFFDQIWPGELSRSFPIAVAAAFGFAAASAGILGDLVESVLKRDAKVKDAGWLLPGVGGVLDRIDSILLAFPVMYYMLLAYYYFVFVG